MKKLVTIALLTAAALSAAPEKHVRVILDISQSMRGTRTDPANDPSGFALVATTMLYDLARYDLGPDGTFKVRTFDVPADTRCPGSVPRTAAAPWREPVPASARDNFVRSILDIYYDAPCTFFYPYLESGIADLSKTRRGDDVRRILILITDGLTEPATRDEERRLLQSLAPRLISENIDLYVVAFGATAKANEQFFREIFRFSQPGGTGGELFANATGADLIDSMIRIFEMSFSYKAEVVSGSQLNLEAGMSPRHVAVLARYDPPRQPTFTLGAPKAASAGISTKGPLATAVGHEVPKVNPAGSGRPISYGVLWIVGPAPGDYTFRESGAQPAQVAILRPRNLRLQLRSVSGKPTDVAMVNAPMRLGILVAPADGGKADPGDVNVQFRVRAVRSPDSPEGFEYVPKEEWVPPATPNGVRVPDGREYEIQPVFLMSAAFQKPPRDGKAYYDGYLEARAQVDGKTIASLSTAHPIRIYPYLSVRPNPERSTLANRGAQLLRGGETGCADFSFESQGSLQATEYTLSADIDPSLLRGNLTGAKVFIEGQPLETWRNGRKIPSAFLTGRKMRICMVTPKRSSGGERDLPVRFALWQSDDDPYKKLDVVRPMSVSVKLEPAGFLQRWSALWALLTTLLLLALLWWLLRNAIGLPDDFRLSQAEAGGALLAKPLAEPSLAARLLGRRPVRPVYAQNGGIELGSVVPQDRELYSFRPRKGFFAVVDEATGQTLNADAGGSFALEANRSYRVKSADREYRFRPEFEGKRNA
jgi:hypothetical protein